MAVKAINNTTSFNGLVPTLLVYRAYLRISNLDPPTLFITEQAAVIQKAIAKLAKLQAKQAVNSTLHYYNRFNITSVYNLLLNSKVLIQYKNSNWTKPYHLLAIENKIYYIQLPSGLTSFRSIFINPYFQFKDTYNIKLDKLEVFIKLDKLKVPIKLDKLEVFKIGRAHV